MVMDKYLFEFQDKLLEAYNASDLKTTLTPEDDNSFLNGIVRFLCYAIAETLYSNKVPLRNIKFTLLTMEYIAEDKVIEFTLPLINDVILVCGVCLLTKENGDITEQPELIKDFMGQNGIRGVFVEFKAQVETPDGSESKLIQEVNGLRNDIAPKILNKIRDKQVVLN